MPKRNTHLTVGVMVGAGAALCTLVSIPEDDRSGWILIGGALGGAVGAAMPDVIDLPTGPNHRAIGHSISVNGVVALPAIELAGSLFDLCMSRAKDAKGRGDELTEVLWQMAAGAVWGMLAGQLSHLVLDSMTPRSLPI